MRAATPRTVVGTLGAFAAAVGAKPAFPQQQTRGAALEEIVVRGPQGTLFGRNSIGGAMRLVTQEPRGDGSGTISATIGDFDRTEVRASYDFALAENLFARIAAASKKRDGYVDLADFTCERPAEAGTLPSITRNRGSGCRIGTLGGEDSIGARVSLRYLPSESVTLSFTYDYSDDNAESQADVITAIGNAPAFGAWNDLMFATYGVRYDERFLTGSFYKNYATFRDPVTGLINDPMRYSEDDKNVNFDNTIIVRRLENSDDSTDYQVGVDWRFGSNNDKMLYASVATGYRPLAYNPRPFQPSQLVPVEGEELTAYEIGVKGDFVGGRLRFNTALFYSDYEQRIVSRAGFECLKDPDGNIIPGDGFANPEPGGPATCSGLTSRTNYFNVPGEISGVEFEFDYRPTGSLLLSGGGGYTDWSSPDIVSGTPVFVPEWNANLALQYDFFLEGGGTLSPRIDGYFQTEICSQLDELSPGRFASRPTSCVDAYELFNLRLTYRSPMEDWSIAIGATNLTDEEYLLNVFDLTAFGQPFRQAQPGRPREWFLSFTRSF